MELLHHPVENLISRRTHEHDGEHHPPYAYDKCQEEQKTSDGQNNHGHAIPPAARRMCDIDYILLYQKLQIVTRDLSDAPNQ